MPFTCRHLGILLLVAGLGQAMAQGPSPAGIPEPMDDRPSPTPQTAERGRGSASPDFGETPPSPSHGRNGPIPLDPPSRANRSNIPSAELSKTGWKSAATVGGSLAVVLGLFFVVAWLMRRAAPGAPAVLPSEVFEVLGRAALAGRQQVHLIRLGGKLVLLSVSPTGIETLSEVTEADEVQRLVGLCRHNHPSSATAVFRRVFEQFHGEAGRSDRWTDGPSAARSRQVAQSGYSDKPGEEADG
jgi:flagellar biogenesis protein FliO